MSYSQSSVEYVCERIALLERLITVPVSGSPTYAYETIPLTLASAQLPCFINFPRQLISTTLKGSDERGREYWEIRNYELRLYHSPLGTGVEEEKSQDLLPWIDKTYEVFMAYPHLKLSPYIVDSKITSDSGITTVEFALTKFLGVTFNLAVSRLMRWTLQEDE